MTGRDALLPWPDGDPANSDRIAGQLALVAARVEDTAVTREGGRGWGLARSWSGPAFEAARAEAAVVASRSADFGAAVRPVVTALQAYAAALTEARRRIDALREEWDRGVRHREQATHEATVGMADPTLLGMTLAAAQRTADREWDRLQAELRGRHTAALRPVTAAGERATACVWGFLRSLPGGSAAEVRAGLLAQLPLTDGALRLADARAEVARLMAESGRPVEQWGPAEAALIASLGGRVQDPLIAQALMEAIRPECLGRLVERLLTQAYATTLHREESSEHVESALAALAAALVRAADGQSMAGADSATLARFTSWRVRWLGELATTGPLPVDGQRADPPFTGFVAQAALLDRADPALVGKGTLAAYARIVGPALVEADRQAAALPRVVQDCWDRRLAGDGIDPVASLLRALQGDVDTLSDLLLRDLGDGYPIARYLAGERLVHGGGGRSPAIGAFAEALRRTAMGVDERSVAIAGAAIDGFAATAELVGKLGPDWAVLVDHDLQVLRPIVGALMTQHPDAVWDALNDPLDAVDWPEKSGSSHPWAALGPNGWTVRVLNRSRLAALIGEFAKDREGASGDGTGPALATLLGALIDLESDEVSAALASADPERRQAALVRLGQVSGFLAESAGAALIVLATGADKNAQARRDLVDAVTSSLQLPGLLKRNLPGLVASTLLSAVRSAIQQLGYGDTSVDHAQRAQRNAAAARSELDDTLRKLGFDLVSASGSWDPDDDPLRWLSSHPGVSFCGPDGRPLPLDQQSSAQHARFRAWASGVPAYTTVPSTLVAQVEEGSRAVRSAIAGR
jgi:hypothetical protein